MSVEATAAMWARRDLSATEKLVAVRLGDHAHPDGTNAYPSIARLREDTGLSERAIQGAIARLVAKGAIRRDGCHGQWRTNRYVVVLTPASPAPPQEMHPAADAPPQDVPPPPAPAAPTPPQEVRPDPAGAAPKPSRTTTGTVMEPSVAALAHRTGKVDLLFDAVVLACEMDPTGITPSARGALNKALKDLRSVGATAMAIEGRAAAFRATYPDLTLTPNALAKHWPQLNPAKAGKRQTSAPTGRSLSAIDKARQR